LKGLHHVDAGSRAQNQGIYAYNGNTFIIRVTARGDVSYLRAYRLAGDQWEPFGYASMPTRYARARKPHRGTLVERIYTQGQLVGHSDVDLNNPLNTLLNKNFGGREGR
jgi:hypothetical protein